MDKIGDLEKNSKAIRVIRPKYNKEMYQKAASEGVDKLTLREGGGGTLRSFINTTNVERQRRKAAARGRGVAYNLSGHLHGCRGRGMGELVLQVREDEQGSRRPQPKWNQQGKTLWKIRDAKERCDAHHDQTYATKIERCEEVR